MELIKVSDSTYYIKNNTNIGVVLIDKEYVYLIDSGNDSDAGKKILKVLDENNFKVKGIINTHSNADHIGGNKLISQRTACDIYAYNIEKSITNNPILEPSFLYGSYPFKDLKNKFLMANASNAKSIDLIKENIEYINLQGHFFDMIGIKTKDNIYFLADSLFSEETISKYHVFFIYNVKAFLSTLDYLETLDGKLYIPSHGEALNDIKDLIKLNRNKVIEITNVIYNYLDEGREFEDILKYIFDKYNLIMNVNQYYLVGSTIKSYLSYLYDEEKIKYEFIDNKMFWIQKNLV